MPVPTSMLPKKEFIVTQRPRRNRLSSAIRNFHTESWLSPQHFVYPLFIHEKQYPENIDSMPGCKRHSMDSLVEEVKGAISEGINAICLFPKVPDNLKTPLAEEAYNPSGLIPRAIRTLKNIFPNLVIVTDVALDPYNSDGHDGVVSADGRILNDVTVEILCKQALCQAQAGADIIAPSDMMDGRIGAIRKTLDTNGFEHVLLLSYTAKYASSFYGPFRDALDSAPSADSTVVPKNKKTYQMDTRNAREALRELALDEAEGADIVMVKPGLPYLDVVHRVRNATTLPVAVYQVSGEYASLHAAARNGWLNLEEVMMESLYSIRRAGADIIFSYFARDASRVLRRQSRL